MTGLGASIAIGLAGWSRQSLSTSGLIGAIVTGTIITARGGYGHAAILVGFFASSSILSRLSWRQAAEIRSFTSKGARRNIWQVAANGGVATVIASMSASRSLRLAYIGSLAAATGDTWATEIGSRGPGEPRHILTLQPVPKGSSGGVSLTGAIASFAGGLFLGLLATATGILDPTFRGNRRNLIVTGIVAGGVGSLVDSVVGASAQERRWCDRCNLPTEQATHLCGSVTRIIGGVPGLTNDVVNLICTLSGALIGWSLDRLLGSRHPAL